MPQPPSRFSGLLRLLWIVLTAPVAAAVLCPPTMSMLALFPWGAEGPPSAARVVSRLTVLYFVLAVVLLRKPIGYLPDLRGLLRWEPAGRRHLLQGCWCALAPLLGLAVVLVMLGAWHWLPQPPGKILSRLPGYVFSAVLISLLEETLFRGIILGTTARALGARAALVATSAFFALLHPLGTPEGAAPDASLLSGFTALAAFTGVFQDPLAWRQMVGYFLVGAILARATLRTGRLWFAYGLHFGWVFFIRSDGLFLSRSKQWSPVFFGNNRLVDGVLIWLFLLLIYILVDRMLRRDAAGEP